MLCDFELFFAHNICLHGNIHFICLIQIKTQRYIPHTANQPKNTQILISDNALYLELDMKLHDTIRHIEKKKSKYNTPLPDI